MGALRRLNEVCEKSDLIWRRSDEEETRGGGGGGVTLSCMCQVP